MPRFTNLLLNWHQSAQRELPWKNTSDPYKIWISEIILQQTRVDQGIPYYLKFIKSFPDVNSLASAHEDNVLKHWEGLGYYSRARNLHYTAKYIVNTLEGIFPKDYLGLLKLKGVGPYTSAAIASFAYNLPHPVIDGNVLRVISRFYGIYEPVDLKTTYNKILGILSSLIPLKKPAIFNQAMMDFGATVCTPKNTRCDICPLHSECFAFSNEAVNQLPIKIKVVQKTTRHLHYFLISSPKGYAIQYRSKGIWQGLYELPLVETPQSIDLNLSDAVTLLKIEGVELKTPRNYEMVAELRHMLTHQTLYIKFYSLKVKQIVNPNINLVEKENLSKFAYPIVIKNLLANILKIE